MATRTNLTSARATNAAAGYTTDPFTPTANRLVLAFVMSRRAGGGGAATPTAQGNGLTWTPVASVAMNGSPDRRLTCLRAFGAAPTTGALSFDFGGETQSLCAWSVFEYDGIETSGAGVGAVVQQKQASGAGTTLAIPVAPLIDAASIVVGGITLQDSRPITPGAGFAEIDERQFGAPPGTGTLQTQDRTGAPSAEWSWTGSDSAAAIALEIKPAPQAPLPAPPLAETETLARRFEPVLFFHTQEKFFPSDAKRYVEHCALWKAEAPFDSKHLWGGKGLPFDRAPVIDYGQIQAAVGEGGTLLGAGGNTPDSADEERFLDLAGWKDKAGNVEPKVTQQSKNTYSNRTEIEKRYNNADGQGGVKKLRESRFWYHAELFDNARLKTMLATVTAPDLVTSLGQFKNAALLNYYLFYPAHEEGILFCTNIEATEFACHGGAWACVSVLLERDGTTEATPYYPSLIGYTGKPLPNWPAKAFDDGDLARRLVMKVSKFSDAKTEGEHPRLFVAAGTHSLYLQPGTVSIEYAPGRDPHKCGLFETPQPAPPPPDKGSGIYTGHPAADLGLFWVKIIAGSAVGGALGAAAGLVWAIAEAASSDYGLNVVGTAPYQPTPDATGQPGNARVVKPKGLAVPDAGANPEEWQSTQGLALDDRRYDFLVDRERQKWWPSEFEMGGAFDGRWGPRVDTDPFGRRAGMRFPPFWRMFFLAVENGKNAGTL
jgi:hypothetical protein